MNAKPSRHLNLLRARRKRSALSQREIAFLLGAHNGSKVSRYEQLTREPELKTALAYEVIFKCPVSELFPGLFKKVKAVVQERAKVLAKRALQGNSKSLLAQKRKSVANIINQEKKKDDEA
jgi:transcriptional regulator with XRE-family HTH domain